MKKAGLIVLGLLLSLLFLECILRTAGCFMRPQDNRFYSSAAGSRVLCLGDSYTYGLGVRRDETYPAQMRKILETKGIEVINLGVPGMNSPVLAARAEELLDVYHPDIVLLMIGVNDRWNLEGFVPVPETFPEKVYSLLRKTRIYRFFRILAWNLNPPGDVSLSITGDESEKISRTLREMEKAGGLNERYYYQAVFKGNEYRERKEFDRANLFYSYALMIKPHGRLVSSELTWMAIQLTILANVRDGSTRSALNLRERTNIREYVKKINLTKEVFLIKGYFADLVALSNSLIKYRLFREDAVLLSKAFCATGGDNRLYEQLDELFIKWNDTAAAITFYSWLNENYPGDERTILRLARQYKKACDFIGSVGAYERVLKIDPADKEAAEGVSGGKYFIANGGQRKGLIGRDADLLRELERTLPESKKTESVDDAALKASAPDLAAAVERQENTEIAKAKTALICRLCKERKVRLLLLSYPELLPGMIKELAEERHLELVDLRGRFTAAVAEGKRSDYFLEDGHCTRQGNALIAEAVASRLLPLSSADKNK